MPRMSTEFSERVYAGALDVAGGNSRMVIRAFSPHANGDLVTFEEALERIVAWRLHAHNPKVGIAVKPRSPRRPRPWYRWR